MKTFTGIPYRQSPDFQKYLENLKRDATFDYCEHLRVLPEDVNITYPSGPPRKYGKGGLFCTIKSGQVIHVQCDINSSPIRKDGDGKLAVICLEGKKLVLKVVSSEEISDKKRKEFLNNRL